MRPGHAQVKFQNVDHKIQRIFFKIHVFICKINQYKFCGVKKCNCTFFHKVVPQIITLLHTPLYVFKAICQDQFSSNYLQITMFSFNTSLIKMLSHDIKTCFLEIIQLFQSLKNLFSCDRNYFKIKIKLPCFPGTSTHFSSVLFYFLLFMLYKATLGF